jgi:hypothetical protein
MRAHSTRAFASLAAVVLLLSASPSTAAWEGSRGEDALAKGVDALIVRPLASARVVIGALMFLPAALLSSPSGREGFDAAYDTLIEEPVEYAFRRELGDF